MMTGLDYHEILESIIMKLLSRTKGICTELSKSVKLYSVIFLGLFASQLSAHGTQVEYCFTNNGMVRIYIEHWHGNVTNFSQSMVNMTITVNGVATTMNVPASGFVHDTPQGSLPDCSAPTVQLSECTVRSDNYNDWAYFDFPAPECYNSLIIRVNSVTDPTYVLLECGGGLGGPIYPAETPVLMIEDELPPYIECGEELPDIVLACGDPVPEPEEITAVQVTDDCTDEADLTLTVSEEQKGANCSGPMITRTYTFTDDLDRMTDCEQLISYAPDRSAPELTCPRNLTVGCDDPAASDIIVAWLDSYTASDNCDEVTVTSSYTEGGFSFLEIGPTMEGSSVFDLGMICLPLLSQTLIKPYSIYGLTTQFYIKETTKKSQYDKVITSKLRHVPGMQEDFSDVIIVDAESRILPMEFSDLQVGESVRLSMQVPELKAGQDNSFTILYSACHDYGNMPINSSNQAGTSEHIIISDVLSISVNIKAVSKKNLAPQAAGPRFTYQHLIDFMLQPPPPSSGSQTVTFTATDECGNTTTCTATISVVDNTDPLIDCPTDITIECGDPNNDAIITNWLDNATADDTCDDSIISVANNFTTLSAQECGGVTTVTFTATDDSGNTATCRSTITHEDSTPPDFIMKPQNLIAECVSFTGAQAAINEWTAANGNGMAMDDCDPTLRWSFTLDSQVDNCGYTYDRTYTFTVSDDCGNTATSTATVSVVDETPPTINLVWEELIQACSASNESNLARYLEQNKRATDRCSVNSDLEIDWVLFNDVSSCGGTIDRTYIYTATDECGNSSTALFHYMTTDTALPTWAAVPGTLVIDCGDEDNPLIIKQWMEDVEESMYDACGGELMISNNFTGDLTEDCNQNTVITWTVEDECGNSRDLNRTIAVRDYINPIVVNCPEDFSVNVDVDNCSSNIIFSTPIGFDQCTDVVTVNQTTGPASGSAFPLGTTRIIFEAIDDCGRRSDPDCIFNITVVDSDIPSVDCPSNVEACTLEGLCYWTSDESVNPMSSDNCSGLTIQVEVTGATTLSRRNGTAANMNFQSGTSEVCYYLMDDAGNETSCCFDVIVSDCGDPVVNCPSDLSVVCDGSGNTAELATWLGAATASDNCSSTFTFSNQPFNTISGCGAANSTVYQFTATDESGNSKQCLATFNINDTVDPIITTEASDRESDCENAETDLLDWLNSMGDAEASDGCGEVTWSHDFNGRPLTGCSGITSSNSRIQTGGLIDNSNWSLGSGSETGYNAIGSSGENNRIMDVDPFGNNAIVWEAGNDAASNADGGWNTPTFPIDNTKLYRYSVWVNRKVLGANGRAYLGLYGYGSTNGVKYVSNSATIINSYFWYSASPPTMIPEDEWVLVVGHVYPHNHTGTTNHPDSGLYTVANDRIGNTIWDYKWLPQTTTALHRNYLFYSTDTDVRQQFIYPRVDCVDGTEPSIDGLRAGYDFGIVDPNTYSSLNVTFTATDGCGNTTTSQANFSVSDTEEPSINCPADITLECGDVLNDAVIELWLGSTTSSDNCSEPVITNSYPQTFTASCGSTGSYSVEFMATDGCDNTSTCTSVIIMEDSEPPVFLMKPQDLVVECGQDAVGLSTWLKTNGNAMAQDRCDADLSWEVNAGEVTSGCGDSESIEYTFTVTDDCGNFSSATALYVFEDTKRPMVNPPADITVECGAVATSVTEWQAGAKASDDCGDGFTFEAVLFNSISDCGDSEVEVYQFTATDACGNQATALASYTIEDTRVPIIFCPTALVLECGGESNDQLIIDWLSRATGTDTCGDVVISENFNGVLPANCGGMVSVAFTVTDACGNTNSCITNISMDDTALPDFDNCPDDLTVNVDVDECGSNPIFSTPFALDNCDVTVIQTAGIASGNTFPVGTTSIEFTATDDCGNTALCQFDLTVVDSDVPLILCPVGSNNVCVDEGTCLWASENIAPSLGQENCDDYTISYTLSNATTGSGVDDASGSLFNIGMTVTCYTITDASGNSSSCCFHMHVADCEDPEITCPTAGTFECDGAGNTSDLTTWLGGVSAIDNCEDAPEITSEVYNTISDCGGASAVTYEFTATDNSDNSSVCRSTFTVKDRVAPILDSSASDLTLECEGGATNAAAFLAWLNDNGGATASDLCSDLIWSSNFTEELSDLCGETGARTVTFTAIDACGNSTMTSAVFVIRDVTDPVIVCPLPIVLECNDVANDAVIANWLSSAAATDACAEVVITHTFPDVLSTDCGDTGEYVITFKATDACDNESECSSMVTIEDSTLPGFELNPQDLILECADANSPAFIASWLMANGNGIASDVCSAVVWTNAAGEPIPECGSTSETPYVFTITDDCGNTSSALASVVTENTTPPSLTAPMDMTVECDGSGNDTELLSWLDSVTGQSECGSVNLNSNLFNTISACGGGSEQVYIFTATDECGNQSTALSSFIIADTSVPTPVCPVSLMLECGDSGNDQAITAWLLSLDITDANDCSGYELSNNYNGDIPGLLCDGDPGVIIQFTATDECGNTGVCQSIITRDDTTVPYFVNCPTDMTVNVDTDLCTSNVVYSQPVALDECDEDVSVALTSGIASGTAFPIGSTTILFTATDECDNTSTCTFDITVVDSDIPQIDCPSNRVVVCTDEGTCRWEATEESSAVFAENCADQGYDVTYVVSGATTAASPGSGIYDVDADDVIFELGSSRVCYTISDDAGNSSLCCFDVVVEDCEQPEIACPTDLIVECDGMGNTAELTNWLGAVTASDICDSELRLSERVYNTISGCGDTDSQVYQFSAEDDFGNTIMCFAEFGIEDTTVPVIEMDAVDLTVQCSGTGNSATLTAWLNDYGDAAASDLCGDITWTHNLSAPLIEICDGTSSTTVVFTATDACGNSNTTSAVFMIEDTAAPVLDCPVDITLECAVPLNDVIIENWLNGVSATDACSEVTIADNYDAVFVDACGLTGVYTVTFRATDNCSNETSCVRTITFEDSVEPNMEIEAQDLLLECSAADNAAEISMWEASFGSAIASDACSDEELSWAIIDQVEVAGCGNTTSTLYTFEVADNCGNTTTTQASVILEDNSAPVLTVPVTTTQECQAIALSLADWLATVSATDECGEVTLASELWNTVSGCGSTDSETYIFTATDACGNETTGFSDYIIEDTSIPTVFCPDDLALDCGDENNDQIISSWLNSATATDLCLAPGSSSGSTISIASDYPGSLPDLDCNGGTGIPITFTATDDCDNMHSCVATITMDDTTTPYFSDCPLDLVVNVDVDLCESNVVYSRPVALDDCDENVEVALSGGIPSGTAFPIGTTTILFTATDACGNTSTCKFDITVVDSDIPSIECPSNDVILCTDEGTCSWRATDQSSAIYGENCEDEGYTVTYTVTGVTTATSATTGLNDVSEDEVVFNLGVSEVCYTIADAAGNSSSCCFDVVVEDCEEPVITCPTDLVVECDGARNEAELMAWMATVTATDNCDDELDFNNRIFNTISDCANANSTIYEFVVEDDFGNSHPCLAEFNIEDTTSPEITAEAEALTIECNPNGNSSALVAWLTNVGGASATDICNDVSWSHDYTADLTDDCGGTGITTVVFTATDACGNTSTTAATFTIQDTTDPQLECPVNITLQCSAEINAAVIRNWLSSPNGTDNCSRVEVSHNYESVFTASCGMTGVHLVTFTATDACDNVTTCDRNITIVDTTDPTIEAPAQDLILECAGDSNEEMISEWEADYGGAVASDACATVDLTWAIIETVEIGACGNTISTRYTFEVTDNCGNTNTTQASVIIEDETPPELTVPVDQTEECGNIAVSVEMWLSEAGGSDACGDVTITTQLWNTISGCGSTDTETYLFTATDACGNLTTGLADYSIVDTSMPTVICPGNLFLMCGEESNDQIIARWLNSAMASDSFDCSTYSITSDYPGSLPTLNCIVGAGIPVSFTVKDACDNTHSCVATITMDDDTAPYFSNCPQDLVVNIDVDLCESNVVYSTPVALDDCDENVAVVLTSGLPSGSAFPIGTTTILFTATDACGNSSTCEFDITVVDSDIPTIACPSNKVVVCTDDGACTWEATDESSAIYGENCEEEGYAVTYTVTGTTTATSGDSGLNDVDEDNVIFNLGVSEVCYTITDAAGNFSSCCYDVVVEDCEDPVIACPADLVVECDGAGNEAELTMWLSTVTGTDNCDDVLEFSNRIFNTISNCANANSTIYEFFVVDDFGNSQSCLAEFTIEDTTSPELTAEAEALTLECNPNGNSTALVAWLSNYGGASAIDICNDVNWSHDYFGDLTDDCGGTGMTMVVFTATDACGNTSTTAAGFTIEDTTEPEINCPSNITLECGSGINDAVIANWLSIASGIDNCSEVTVVDNYEEIFEEACGLTGVHEVTFTMTDACDNLTACDRTIRIEDTTPPVIAVTPVDLILECASPALEDLVVDWEENFGGAMAVDECSDEEMVWSIIFEFALGGCGDTGSTLYTFQVMDNCGNTSTTQASVIVEDTAAPELTLPEDQVEECNDIAVSVELWLAEATATDACGTVNIQSELWNTISDCGGTYRETYIFTAMDACGNVTEGFADYEYDDTSVPIITCPSPIMLICGNESNDLSILNWLNSATAIDANECSAVTITSDFPLSLPALDCNGGVGITINFTATDECGNSSSCMGLISIDDSEPPYFSNCPIDMTVNADVDLCESNIVYSQPIALDDCDEDVEVALIEGIPSGMPFPLGTTTITFEAVDVCGNASTCSFDITVVDSGLPSIDCPSNDVVVCTDIATCVWLSTDQTNPIYNDNCPGQRLTYEVSGNTLTTSAATGVNTIEQDAIIFNLGENKVIYTISDPSGNEATCSFDVIVEDCEDPGIICNDIVDVACGSENLNDWFSGIASTVTDNCDAIPELEVDTLLLTDFSSCGNTFDRVYMYSVTDMAGNSSSCIARYETDDAVVPVITEAMDLTLECRDGSQSTALLAWLNNNGGATATDACSEPIAWTNNYTSDLTLDCGSNGAISVTFIATDDCGNTSTAAAVYEIEDTTPPELSCPENLTLECADGLNEAVIGNWLRTGSAIDACQGKTEVVNSYPNTFADGCGSTGSYTVTFASSDDCGNLVTCQRAITINDVTVPEIVEPAENLFISCASTTIAEEISDWLANNGAAEATDSCSDEPLTWESEIVEVSDGCGGFSTTSYVFTVTDNCGNTSTTLAQVRITDDTDPNFDTSPQDMTVNCSSVDNELALEVWLENNGGAMVSDECATEFEWEYDLVNIVDNCGNTNVRTYRFTVVDDCGNASTAEADFEIIDTELPLITVEASDFVVECNGSSNSSDILNWLNNKGNAEATDLCSDLTWTNDYGTILADCGTTGGVTVTFAVTDDCGNSSTSAANFIINDETAPVWILEPQDLEIECDGSEDPMGQVQAWLNTAGGAEAEDDCSAIAYSNDFSAIDLECDMEGGIVVTFTVTDACGNFTTATALLSITDDVPPVITLPAQNQTVECDGAGNLIQLQAWLDMQAGAMAEDACSSTLTPIYKMRSVIGNCGITSTSVYDFTYTDACGNTSVVSMGAFIIEDTTPPVFDEMPVDVTVECDGAGNDAELQAWLDNNAAGNASDVCSEPITWSWDLVMDEDSCGISGIQVFRFTIEDDCGNTNEAQASFTIEDTTEPELIAGEDMVMDECDGDFAGNILAFDSWLNNHAGATAIDLCGDMSWSNDYDIDNWITTCGNTRYVDVTFTVTDACKNSSATIHRFGVGDNSPPVWVNCPRPPVIVDAPEGWCSSYVNYPTPIAEDNCSDLTVTQVDNMDFESGSLFPVGLTLITFVAEDECGNTSLCELKIIVNDFHTPPSIVCPIDISVENDPSMCGAIVMNIAPLNVEDNCMDNLSVTYEISDENGLYVHSGFEDASGYKFDVGSSTVNYTISDQPLILITEIIQDGVTTGIEITNFGPAIADLSCLDIFRTGPDNESHNVPNGTLVPVGGIYTQLFTNIPSSAAAGYYLSFVDRIIDGVSINGHTTAIYSYAGSTFGDNIYRNKILDHDISSDFTVADNCFTGSFGAFNPGLTTMAGNGSVAALQEAVPSVETCEFNVVVEDTEPAYCAQYDTTRICVTGLELTISSCSQIEFNVPAGLIVGDVNLVDLQLTHGQVGDLSFRLTSPSGTTISLFSNLCGDTAGIDLSLDDTAQNTLAGVACEPMGGGDTYEPIGRFKDFFDENAGGIWILHIDNVGDQVGILEGACLEILELQPYDQADVYLENDLGECGAEYTWQHPQIDENCCEAIMTITFESDEISSFPPSGNVRPGGIATEMFGVGTTRIIYTIIDESGNKSICVFEVEVEDTEDPVIDASLCQDQTIQLAAGQCFVPVTALNLPPIVDNCGTGNLSFTPSIAAGLPSGDHPLTLGIIDASGNAIDCQFTITVNPYEIPDGQMSCLGQVNLSLGPDCKEQITADMMLGPGQVVGCTEDYCVIATDAYGDEIPGAIVTAEHIGQLITVKVCTDCTGGNCCWGNILVEKKVTSVACPDEKVTIVCNQIFEPAVVGEPLLETCEQEVYISYEDNFMLGEMCDAIPGTIERTWYITDANNNVLECVQVITIAGFDINAVNFPADTIVTTADINCVDVASQPELLEPDHTGWPDLDGVPIHETGDGLCSHFWNWDDQILYNCEGSYEILRKWLVRDMCDPIAWGTNPIEYYQSIKVIDNMAPEIIDCADGVISAPADYNCNSEIYLNDYFPEFRDVCGSIQDTIITVTPGTAIERPAGSGQFYLTNMSPGTHTVKLTVKDQCSNVSRCSFDVNVIDQSGPNVACEQDVQVSLNSSGIAELPAEVLDDGSFDNCTPIEFEIYRMLDVCNNASDLEPGPYVTLCCEDISADPILLMLRVWDDADSNGMYGTTGDFFNECMVRVFVSSATIPNISCPPGVTIACDADYTNLNITGQPALGSACNFVTADYTDDIDDLNSCNTGRVVRTWNIIGQNIDCKQTIEIAAAMPFTENDIVWPADFEGDCAMVNVADRPLVNNVTCSQIGIDVESDTFFFNQEACYKVINNWAVIDWCQYDDTVTPAQGYWTRQQVIKITSSDPPVITGCQDQVLGMNTADCEVSDVVITNSAMGSSCASGQGLSWSYQIDFDGDTVSDMNGIASGSNPSINIQSVAGNGLSVSWMVTDGCGNNASCTQLITLEDSKNPTAYCHSLATAVMVGNGEAEVWVTDIDAGSTDNCTATGELILSFESDSLVSSLLFDCEDIPNGVSGDVTVTLYVTDAAGNQTNCTTQLNLQDNSDTCTDGNQMMVSIGGQIKTLEGEEIKNVMTTIEEGSAQMDDMDMTDEQGIYVFDELPEDRTYRITPQKSGDFLEGLSTVDIIVLQRHILGVEYLDSPYKVIAADVSWDDKVNGQDLFELRRFLLGEIDSFTSGPSWRFVDESYGFADPLKPFPIDEEITLQALSESENLENDFVGVKVGDVDVSLELGLIDNDNNRSRARDYQLFYTLEAMSSEHEDLIPVYSNDVGIIQGFQFALELSEGKITDVLPGSVDLESHHYHMKDDRTIAMSWNSIEGAVTNKSIPLFYLSVTDMDMNAFALSLHKQAPAAEIYLTDKLITKIPSLSLDDRDGIGQFTLYQNEPNPFKEWTEIGFYLPESQEVDLSFYTVEGELIYGVTRNFEAGQNKMRITADDLGNNNVVVYRLSSDLYNDSKKMIIVR